MRKSLSSITVARVISKEFNRLTFVNVILEFYTFATVLFLSITCNTVWYAPHPAKNVNGEPINIGSCMPPKVYMAPLYVIDIIVRCILIILYIVFTIE